MVCAGTCRRVLMLVMHFCCAWFCLFVCRYVAATCLCVMFDVSVCSPVSISSTISPPSPRCSTHSVMSCWIISIDKGWHNSHMRISKRQVSVRSWGVACGLSHGALDQRCSCHDACRHLSLSALTLTPADCRYLRTLASIRAAHIDTQIKSDAGLTRHMDEWLRDIAVHR